MHWKTFDWKSQKVGQKGEVLTKTVYKCGFCKGTGLMPSKRFTRCPVCLGNRTIKVTPPAIICAYCDGQGKSHLNRDLTCIICKGKGVVSISSKDIEICPSCKGRGREKGSNLPCLTCRGKGVIIIKRRISRSIKRGKPSKKREVSKSFEGIPEVQLEEVAEARPKESDLTSEEITQHIKERAQHIWEEEGRPAGKDFDIWLKAEKEVLSQLGKRGG